QKPAFAAYFTRRLSRRSGVAAEAEDTMRGMYRHALAAALIVLLAGAVPLSRQEPASSGFPLDEVTIAQLQDAMSAGRYTARRLVELYAERINAIDRKGPTLRSVIELNPDALSIADALDAE